MNVFLSINAGFNHWLNAPELNAAGRMSLFRIVYGLFYLWYTRPLSYYAVWTDLPQDQWDPIITFSLLKIGRPPGWLFEIMPVILLVSLVLLTVGFRTRLATLLVLISGLFLAGSYYSFTGKIDHGDTFLVAYIPAVMLFSRWNSNYSLDALLKKQRGISEPPPVDDRWEFIWPMRAILLLLSLLFLGAGYLKMRGGWLTDPAIFSTLLTSQNAIAVINEGIPTPLNPVISRIPLLYIPFQYMGLLFETLFPLALLSRRLRTLFVSMGLFFHFLNAYFLQVNASPLIIAYLIFVDWQALYRRWWPSQFGGNLKQVSTPLLIGISLGLALIIPILWRDINLIRPPMPYALLNPVTIWYVIGPIAFYVMVKTAAGLLWSALRLLTNRSHRQAEAHLAR